MTDRARELWWRKTTQRRRRRANEQRTLTVALQKAFHAKTPGVTHEQVDASKRLLRKRRDDVAKAEKALAKVRKDMAPKQTRGQRALSAGGQWLGRTENNNRAPWLDAWAVQYVGRWMIGQSWCGLYCIVAWAAAGVALPKDTVSTVAILGRARRGDGFHMIDPKKAEPGDLVVMDFDRSRGPEAMHVGLARGPMVNGIIPTREGNTSSGSGGSQNNGGGIYDRTRPASVVVCVARPI